MIGKIERVELREVWRNEAKDFTPWLEENIDALGDELGIGLDSSQREQSAGTFNIDLVAEDENGNPVVIENQLEKSDHDHLGKLLTYLTVREAKTAIWIVADPRPEHIKVVGWLNESTAASFYLVKMEAVRIGDSDAAPLFTLIVGPSDESKQIGQDKQDWAERHHYRNRWFNKLLEVSRKKTSLHANITPGVHAVISTGAGISGLTYQYYVGKHESRVALYIGIGDCDENGRIFDLLRKKQTLIESAFGMGLSWDRNDDGVASWIGLRFNKCGYMNPEKDWPKLHEKLVDTMIRLEKVFKPHIKDLRI